MDVNLNFKASPSWNFGSCISVEPNGLLCLTASYLTGELWAPALSSPEPTDWDSLWGGLVPPLTQHPCSSLGPTAMGRATIEALPRCVFLLPWADITAGKLSPISGSEALSPTKWSVLSQEHFGEESHSPEKCVLWVPKMFASLWVLSKCWVFHWLRVFRCCY